MQSYLTHLECTACHRTYPADQLINTCRECGKVIYARYDLKGAARAMTPEVLSRRAWNLWRYFEILPLQDQANAVTLGEGGTPLLTAPSLGALFGLNAVLIKDEGQNPTGSFKARGLGMAVSRAAELDVSTVAIPSAGNAAAAMSAYAAKRGLQAVVAMPMDAPEVMKAECVAYGARVLLVRGLINDAGTVIREGAGRFGWFDVSTLKEPYRAEGKKTLGLELAEQLGWRVPDAIIYPTGGGTGIVGMWKAFAELEEMGLIGPKRPRMVVVQAEHCAPIVRAFEANERHAPLWPNASTIAAGMRVPIAIGDYLILDAIRQSGGTAMTVTDEEMLEGIHLAASQEGLFVSPESGAAIIASRILRQREFLNADDEVVIFSTGSGLMHTDLVDQGHLTIVDPADTSHMWSGMVNNEADARP